MSRIGKKPIPVPAGVKVEIGPAGVKVTGPLGVMEEPVGHGLTIEQKDAVLLLALGHCRDSALHGTIRARVSNAVTGVATGFTRQLDIVGLGFKAEVQGDKLNLALGFTHPVVFQIPKGIAIKVEPKTNRLTVTGVNKDVVGQVAAEIRSLRPPEPYKGTGVRYVGEHIVRKAGKTAAGVGGGAKK